MTKITDEQRQTVVDALEELQERLIPARRNAIIALFTRYAVRHPEKTKDNEAVQAFAMELEDIADDLAEFSELHIAWALIEHRKSSPYWPKSSDIHPRCLRWHCDAQAYRHRALVQLGLKEPFNHERLIGEESATGQQFLSASEIAERTKNLSPDLAASVAGLLEAAKKNEQREHRDHD